MEADTFDGQHLTPSMVLSQWNESLGQAKADWHLLNADRSALDRWKQQMDGMRAARDDLIRLGRWVGGPRTLMAALGADGLELKLTAGLAWLLRPDGHHRLGQSVLDGFLGFVDLPPADDPTLVRVVVEDTRKDTRADLVVYSPAWTLVVEAKVFATEGKRQLARLHELWGDDPNPTFIFLTRRRTLAISAEGSLDAWHNLTWLDIAGIADIAAVNAAPGVLDYIATLKEYHHA